MEFLQWIYTSCQKGQSSGSGFQTFSMSEGLTNEEIKELEKYGAYIPTNDLPSQPTENEITTKFPISLTFFRLKSGRYGICQSCYIGKDYSGRYGNYFSHALVLNEDLLYFYPILLWNSKNFKKNLLPQEENIDTTPPVLPKLNADKISLSEEINFESIKTFLESDNRINYLKDIINALISYKKTHRRIIVTDNHLNIPFWIAAIQLSFPLKIAHNITFTTYTHDPEGKGSLICFTPKKGGRFSFSNTQRDYEYFIFDFIENNFSKIENKFKLAELATLGFTFSKETLVKFQEFINMFDYYLINEEIEAGYLLYSIANLGLDNFTKEEITKAIEFINKYASQKLLFEIGNKIASILINKLSGISDINILEIVSEFLFKIANQSKNSNDFNNAYNFFFNSLDQLILQNKTELSSILNFNTKFLEQSKEHFLSASLSTERFQKINSLILNNSDLTNVCQNYLSIIIDCLLFSDEYCKNILKQRNELKNFIISFIKTLISNKNFLQNIFVRASKNPFLFIEIVKLSHNLANNRLLEDNLIYCFTFSVSTLNENLLNSIHLELIEQGYDNFIDKELRYNLSRSNDKASFFWKCYKNFYNKNESFKLNYFSDFVNSYLNFLESKEQVNINENIYDLLKIHNDISDHQILTRIIHNYEKTITLSKPDKKSYEKIESIFRIKNHRKINTEPDIIGLIILGLEIEKKNLNTDNLDLSALNTVKYIRNTKQYKNYLEWCLPNLITLISQDTLLDSLFIQDFEEILTKEYKESLLNILKANNKNAYMFFIEFIKIYLFSDFKTNFWNEILIDILLKKERNIVFIKNNVSPFLKDQNSLKKWDSILNELENKKNSSFFNKLTSFFNKNK